MERIAITNGSLLDCTGSEPITNAAVLIEGDRILAAGPQSEILPVEGDYRQIDAGGGMILPGFIDSHVHLMSEYVPLEQQLMTPFSYGFYKAINFFRKTLNAGITCVRDAGGMDLGTKRSIEDGLVLAPRVKISVNMLSITGGHADSWMPSGADLGLFTTYPGMPDSRCDGPSEVRKRVREMLRAGAEVIKIASTGGVMSPTSRSEYAQFSPEELEIIVQEAASHGGVKVMSHAQGAQGIKNALRAGIHSIEHGIFLDDEAIELLLEKKAFLVPTLLAPVSILEMAESNKNVPPHMVAKAKFGAESHKASIARAFKAGVKIAMGTDAGVMPHGTNLRELGLMCDIGMTPMQAIIATTRTAAECLEWQDRVGTIEKGKFADIVVWKTNPLEDIRSLENNDNAVMVMKGGVVVK